MPGASRTKQILAESMKALMKKMPLEKISVSDIVERAEVGRNTFYYHFQDKYDLVNWIFQSESTRFFAEHVTRDNWTGWLEGLEGYFLANKEFYCNALEYTGQNSLQSYLFEMLSDQVVQQARDMKLDENGHITQEELQFAGDFVACAVLGLLVRWAKTGMKERPRQYRDCLRRLCDGSLIRAYLDAGERAEEQEETRRQQETPGQKQKA